LVLLPVRKKTPRQGTHTLAGKKNAPSWGIFPQQAKNQAPRQGTHTLAGKKQIAQMGITTHQAKEKMPK
jgi:hypothetical protein